MNFVLLSVVPLDLFQLDFVLLGIFLLDFVPLDSVLLDVFPGNLSLTPWRALTANQFGDLLDDIYGHLWTSMDSALFTLLTLPPAITGCYRLITLKWLSCDF